MPSQVLITGATGFIGRQLTRDLVSRGQRVRILARSRTKAKALFGDSVEIVSGDLSDPTSVDLACKGIETIYHIAGIYRFGLRYRKELSRINVTGTETLLRSAAAHGTGKIVHLSSASVLQRQTPASRESLLDENDFPNDGPAFSPYKYSKWQSERIALDWARKGLPVTIASTTCPIGTGDETPTPTGRMIQDFLNRRFPFYCHTGLNFVGIRDLSEGLQLVAQSGRNGERYLLCHENLWLKEFLDLLAEQTSLAAPRTCLPSWFIRLIGCGGDAFSYLSLGKGQTRVCLETALEAEQIQFFSNAKARDELGWRPTTSIQENIEEAIEWFRYQHPAETSRAVPSTLGSNV